MPPNKDARELVPTTDEAETNAENEENEDEPPEFRPNFISHLFFLWINPVVSQGLKRPLELDDIPQMYKSDRAKYSSERTINKLDIEMAKPKPSVMSAFIRIFWVRSFLVSLLRIARQGLLIVTSAVLLPVLLDFIQQPLGERSIGEAVAIVLGTALCFFVQSLAQHHYFEKNVRLGMAIRASYNGAVFRKVLKLPSHGLPSGVIINMLNDAARFADSFIHLHSLYVSPLEVSVIVALLIYQLGISAVPGVIITVLYFPFQGFIGRFISKTKAISASKTDTRVRLMTDVLAAMKLVKLYGWQKPLAQNVADAREKELQQLRKIATLKVINVAASLSTPVLALVASFCMYAALGNALLPEKAFTTLALFNLLRLPMQVFPQAVKVVADSIVSFRRLQTLLSLPELEKSNLDSSSEPQVVMEGASFKWAKVDTKLTAQLTEKVKLSPWKMVKGSLSRAYERTRSVFATPRSFAKLQDTDDAVAPSTDDTVAPSTDDAPKELEQQPFSLKSIDLRLQSKQLIAVVGSVGSGKSSFLSAILHDLTRTGGKIAVKGRIAYVPQQSFIVNGTFRHNVLFGQRMDLDKYNRVIHACCLDRDIEEFPGKDLTEIGEKGVNLSGGQRHRLALARAVYSDSDIYLLDDPLHAVDSTVARLLFERCIRGVLKEKAVILVTHQLHVLPECDEILLLKQGSIIERGTLPYLLQLKGEFAQLAASMIEHQTVDDISTKTDEKKSSSSKAPQLEGSSSTSGSAFFQLVKAEDRQTGIVSWKVYQSYMKASGGVLYMSFIIFLYALTQIVRLMVDYWFAVWVAADATQEEIIGSTSGEQRSIALANLPFYGGIYAGIVFGMTLLVIIRGYLFFNASLTASTHLHNDVFVAVLGAPMSFFDTTPVGRLVNRFSSDIDQIDDQLPDSVDYTLVFGLMVVATVIVILVNMWYVGLLFLPLAWLFWKIQSYFRIVSRELKRLDGVSRSPIYAHMTAVLAGLSTVRSYGAEHTFLAESQTLLDANFRVIFTLQMLNRWLGMRLDFLTVFVTAATAAACIFLPIEPAMAGLVFSYVIQLTQNFQWFARQIVETETKMTSVERLLFYSTSVEPEEQNADPYVPPDDWPTKGTIEFNNVSMRYRPELPLVMQNVSFTINTGEKIGIVGRTGAGKTSLGTVLFRLAEYEDGDILIDGISTKSITLERLRASIAIIAQEQVLFEGNVRSNMDPFNKATDDEIWQVLQQAHLADAITRLPLGLLSPVSDHGDNFSVGERQLMCLARALLRKPKILLMDEATAAVDSMTDALVQKTIRERFADCTVLTIAHRLDTIIDADRVLVMDRGRVAEFDEPAVLLGETGTNEKKESIFCELVAGAGPDQERFLRQQAKLFSLKRHQQS